MLPKAATTMSAIPICVSKFFVRLWQTVTVQFAAKSKEAIGFPTISDLPIITLKNKINIPIARIVFFFSIKRYHFRYPSSGQILKKQGG